MSHKDFIVPAHFSILIVDKGVIEYVPGVQKGRYTMERKSQAIKEVKMLKEIEKQTKQKEEHLKNLGEVMLDLYLGFQVMHPDMQHQIPGLRKNYVVGIVKIMKKI